MYVLNSASLVPRRVLPEYWTHTGGKEEGFLKKQQALLRGAAALLRECAFGLLDNSLRLRPRPRT